MEKIDKYFSEFYELSQKIVEAKKENKSPVCFLLIQFCDSIKFDFVLIIYYNLIFTLISF